MSQSSRCGEVVLINTLELLIFWKNIIKAEGNYEFTSFLAA